MERAERILSTESRNSGMLWDTSHNPKEFQNALGHLPLSQTAPGAFRPCGIHPAKPTAPGISMEFPWNSRSAFCRRAQPPAFPRLRDPGNTLPAGSRLHGHGGAAGPPPHSLFPENLRIPGNRSGRQPGHPRDLLPAPPPGAFFPGKIPLGSGIASDLWERSHSRGVWGGRGGVCCLQIFLRDFPKGKTWLYPWMGWEELPAPRLSAGKAAKSRDLIPKKGEEHSCIPKKAGSLRPASGRNPGNVGVTSLEIPGEAKSSLIPVFPLGSGVPLGISSLPLGPGKVGCRDWSFPQD